MSDAQEQGTSEQTAGRRESSLNANSISAITLVSLMAVVSLGLWRLRAYQFANSVAAEGHCDTESITTTRRMERAEASRDSTAAAMRATHRAQNSFCEWRTARRASFRLRPRLELRRREVRHPSRTPSRTLHSSSTHIEVTGLGAYSTQTAKSVGDVLTHGDLQRLHRMQQGVSILSQLCHSLEGGHSQHTVATTGIHTGNATQRDLSMRSYRSPAPCYGIQTNLSHAPRQSCQGLPKFIRTSQKPPLDV